MGKQKGKHSVENKKKIIVVSILLFLIIITLLVIYFIFFKTVIKNEVYIELGDEDIEISKFVGNKIYEKNSSFITDMSKIDLTKVGEHKIEIKHGNKTYEATLKIQDTTPPKVEFKDIEKPINYEINPEDFIESKEDKSEMTVEYKEIETVDLANIGSYIVEVIVKDQSNNETKKECKLEITHIRKNLVIELGDKITVQDIIFDERYYNLVTNEQIEEINNYDVGEYELKTNLEGVEYTTKITVQDTKAPTLTLKEVKKYKDQPIKQEDFIETISDASEYTVNLLSQLDTSALGDKEIKIEAVDKYNNKVEQSTKLHVVEDKEGPVFSGLNEIKVSKNATIDYNKNVSAKDEKDGSCEFSVDSSAVNVTATGTYFATYTSKDKSGNTTTEKRKVVVASDENDVNSLADEVISKLGISSKSAADKSLALVRWSQNTIKYGHTYQNVRDISKAAYYALSKHVGDCFGIASAMQILLTRAGVTNMMVHCTDGSHYWNMVNVGGWKHIDGTKNNGNYPIALMNDKTRYDTLQFLHPRDWDRSAYPAAN